MMRVALEAPAASRSNSPNIRGRLAHALGRRDERPNVTLADDIASSMDSAATRELVALLGAAEPRERHDAIKVLYEIAERRPRLLLRHVDALLDASRSRDNRLVWGALTALAVVAAAAPARVGPHVAAVLDAAGRSSIIARDQAVRVLVAVASTHRYRTPAVRGVLDLTRRATPNQIPLYCERALPLAQADQSLRARLRAVIRARVAGLPKLSQQARVLRVSARLDSRPRTRECP
ncbi:MAG: hypothetical protein U0Q12_28360 [Vicinamibacterales bacterium]